MDARQIILTPQTPRSDRPPRSFGAVRIGVRALAAVAPGLAASLAERLWFSPPRPRLREHARAFLATGERFDLAVDERRVVAWTWGSGPAVVLMHGWGGFGAQMQPFVAPLTSAGFQAVVFDAPSHGQSGPSRYGARRASLFEFAETLHALVRGRSPLAGVIAHSGGATAAAWAIQYFQDFSAPPMAFLAPMASPIRYKRLFHDALGLNNAAMRRFDERTERRFGFKWADLEVPGMARRMNTPPVLAVHDKDDRETSWTESEAIANTWPDAQQYYTSGLGHRRILRDAGVVDRVVAFLRTAR